MAKVTLKTAPSLQSVKDFIARVEDKQRQKDAWLLLDLFTDITSLSAKMWGDSIIGFGRYEYQYASGREGEYFMVGFSPRKAQTSIYVMPGYFNMEDLLRRLGKHKTGKSCLYIKRLEDIDLDVLALIIRQGLQELQGLYPTYPE